MPQLSFPHSHCNHRGLNLDCSSNVNFFFKELMPGSNPSKFWFKWSWVKPSYGAFPWQAEELELGCQHKILSISPEQKKMSFTFHLNINAKDKYTYLKTYKSLNCGQALFSLWKIFLCFKPNDVLSCFIRAWQMAWASPATDTIGAGFSSLCPAPKA